ncbi:recombinase family protein [Kurthia senegalensis]|nr:recombinase family protein [Kurthia senegalensis]
MRIYNVKEKRKQNKSILAVFAEFERDIIQKRTEVGLKVAKKRGKIGSHL